MILKNEVKTKKMKKLLLKALDAFKKAKTIKFNSFITNEEALILQKLKEEYNFKLVNDDAFKYQRFLKEYSLVSGKSLYSSTLKDVHDSNFVVSIGSFLKHDLPHARYAFNNSIILNKGSGLYFHPIADPIMEKIGKKGKTTEFIYHQPLKEEAVLYLLLDIFADENLPEDIKKYIESLKEKRVKTIVETKKRTSNRKSLR